VRGVVLVFGLVLLLATPASAQVYRFGSFGSGEEAVLSPTLVPGLEAATKIDAANAFGLALVNGSVMAYGNNARGELGDGTSEGSATPVPVAFPAGVHVVAIGDANQAGYAVDSTGQGWAWGKAGDDLCLGKSEADVLKPEKVSGITDAIAVQGGGPHVLWLLANGTVESCLVCAHVFRRGLRLGPRQRWSDR
jgi:alpha-tubulin suppressor-like RCC1 family protein